MSEERFDLVIRGRRILTTAGIAPREVGVRNGKIVALEPLGNGLAGAEILDLADDDRCRMCARAPVQRARSMTSATALFSAPRGRDARNAE